MSLIDRLEPKLKKIEERFMALDVLIGEPEVASDNHRLSECLKERGQISDTVEAFRALRNARNSLEEAEAERAAAKDPEMRAYCEEVLAEIEEKIPDLERAVLADFVRDEDDDIDSAIMEIRAGTGGDEASLWAGDLMRMYLRLCEVQRFKVELLSEHRSGVDGFKEVIFSITGPKAFTTLKYESGGHRVQRVPETEAQGRIHTSAATVAILPEATEVEIEIKDSDLCIESFRSSGPGGQSVNKTSSAIRVTHEPSGLVVSCQDEKSQHKNKAKALKILRSRLYDLERQKLHDARSNQRRSLIGSGDRSQRIRTYNFPQSRVTDHRINLSLHNLQAVLDGDLFVLIESLAAYDREQRLQALADELG